MQLNPNTSFSLKESEKKKKKISCKVSSSVGVKMTTLKPRSDGEK